MRGIKGMEERDGGGNDRKSGERGRRGDWVREEGKGTEKGKGERKRETEKRKRKRGKDRRELFVSPSLTSTVTHSPTHKNTVLAV